MRHLSHYITLSLFFRLGIGISFYILLTHLSACNGIRSRNTTNPNVANKYKSENDVLHPVYTIFHRTGTESELHFKINSKQLLYSKQAGGDNFMARIKIQYRLTSSTESKEIADSATVTLTDPFSNNPKDIIGKIDFNATFTYSYTLRVDLFDLNRNTRSTTEIPVDKLNHTTRQNFMLLSSKNKTPLFRDYVYKDEFFKIKYRSPLDKLFVRYYHREFPLPAPPFATSNMMPFEYRADSLFILRLNSQDSTGFNFTQPGFYHIQTDTFSKEGLTLYRFDDDFPYLKKPAQLLAPLRYLTSRNEFEIMRANQNPKAAVDSFWVAAGGSTDRARELVKKFYNRVKDANDYFSSYIEGWKTDRGLIYIIYGPPNAVYRSNDFENWIYGEENNSHSLSFTFLKVINPFTDNDYRLEHNPNYKPGWFNAVDMWRQGRVYAGK